MKLRRKHISLLKNRHKRAAAIAQGNAGVAGFQRGIRMRKSKIGVCRNAFEQLAWAHAPKLIPSHVR